MGKEDLGAGFDLVETQTDLKILRALFHVMQIKIMHGGVLRTFQRVVSDPDFSLFIKEGHSRIYTLLYAQLPRCCSHQEPTYSLLSALRSKERTLGTRLPSCLQQGWGNNVVYNKLSHVLTHSHFPSNYPVVKLVFAPTVSDIFHHFTFLLTGMFIWGTISVQGRTDPLETEHYIRRPVQMSGVPLLL